MMKFRTIFAALALLIMPMTNAAMADDKTLVQAFYDYLSNPTSRRPCRRFQIGNHRRLGKHR